MRTNALTLVSTLVAAASLQAQSPVDVLYTNISDSTGTTARAYSDAIVLWNSTGQRPLAQESHGLIRTGSVRKMKARQVGGFPFLYWYDIITDDIYRGRDANGNGVIDPTEFQLAYGHGASQDGSLDEHSGVWWNAIGNVGSTTQLGQLWQFQDLDSNGDFTGAGESTQVIAGPTINLNSPAVSGVSTHSMTNVVAMANGDAVWYARGTYVQTTPGTLRTDALIRTSPSGQHTLFMAHGFISAVRNPVLPTNPDFGTSLPLINANPLDRLAVDRINDAVFAAVNFTAAAPQQPWVFRCKDGNADGDANDSGEVTLFYDGVTGPVPMTSIDDIEWLNGRLYVSHEANQPAGPCQFVELVDLNNDGDAMDAGEQTVLGGTSSAPLDDPTVIGITVVPSGFFTPASCVTADLRNNGMVAAGGTLTLTFADIPPASQNVNTLCVGLLTFGGDVGIGLPGGCIIGLLPDPLTNATISLLIGAGPTGRSLALPGLPYPPLPVGTSITSAGLIVDLTTLGFTGVTHSARITVQ